MRVTAAEVASDARVSPRLMVVGGWREGVERLAIGYWCGMLAMVG